MSLTQDRLVLGALLLSESAWLFGVFGVVGAMLAQQGSPLDWLAVLTIMFLAMVVSRIGSGSVTGRVVDLMRASVALAVIYLIVGAQVRAGAQGVDLLWAAHLTSELEPEGYAFRAIAGGILGVAVWLRGAMLSSAEFPIQSLMLSFRLGIIGLALATAVDIAHPTELDTFPMVFIFFAAGLGGLSIGHLLPESDKSAEARTWPRVIGGLVASVLMLGLVFGLLRRGALSYFSDTALVGLDAVVKAIFWAIIIPISFVYGAFVDLLQWLLSPLTSGTRTEDTAAEELRPRETTPPPEPEADGSFELLDLVTQIVEAIVILLIVVLVVYLLAVGFRKMFGSGPRRTRGERESVKEDADPLADIVGLMAGLIPDWFSRGRKGPGISLPDGPSGVIDALRVYYDLLGKAEDEGFGRPPHQTPSEYQPTLAELFPGDLVPAATQAFNRACYGHHPATAEQIAYMRQSLKGLTPGPFS